MVFSVFREVAGSTGVVSYGGHREHGDASPGENGVHKMFHDEVTLDAAKKILPPCFIPVINQDSLIKPDTCFAWLAGFRLPNTSEVLKISRK